MRILKCYTSKRDSYGNCYHAVELVINRQYVFSGNVYHPNLNAYLLDIDYQVYMDVEVLPIRDFNGRCKGWDYMSDKDFMLALPGLLKTELA